MIQPISQTIKEQLMEAGLGLALRLWNNAEFQHLATWPQRNFGTGANTEIWQKVRQAQIAINGLALELKSLLLTLPTSPDAQADGEATAQRLQRINGSLNIVEELIQFSDSICSEQDYFLPMFERELLADCKVLLKDGSLDGISSIPRFGNIPAVCCLLRLTYYRRKIYRAWEDVFGTNHLLPSALKARFQEHKESMTDLHVLCLQSREARLSALAMTLVQLLYALEDKLDMSWLSLPEKSFESAKPSLLRFIESDWGGLIIVLETGLPKLMEELEANSGEHYPPKVQAAIKAGYMVIDIPRRRVFFRGVELTVCFKRRRKLFDTLVGLCREARSKTRSDQIEQARKTSPTFRGQYHRLRKTHPSLTEILPGADSEGHYPITIPRSEIVLVGS